MYAFLHLSYKNLKAEELVELPIAGIKQNPITSNTIKSILYANTNIDVDILHKGH